MARRRKRTRVPWPRRTAPPRRWRWVRRGPRSSLRLTWSTDSCMCKTTSTAAPTTPPSEYPKPKGHFSCSAWALTWLWPVEMCFSEERLAITKAPSPTSYGSRSEMSSVLPPAIRVQDQVVSGPKPVQMTCPYCFKYIKTRVTFQVSDMTFTVCLILFVLLLWPFLWVPFVCDKCKHAEHECPKCGAVLSRKAGWPQAEADGQPTK